MIKKFKIFESIEDDYYTILIKLEEFSKKLKMGFNRLYIEEQKENEYVIYTYMRRHSIGQYTWDQEKKTFIEDLGGRDEHASYKENVKIDATNLTMTWLDINDKMGPEKYRYRFYYAPDELKFQNVDDLIKFLDMRYWKDSFQWDGKPREHPVGRRKFYWEEPARIIKTNEDPYGEESWEYEYPFNDEDD